MIQASKTITNKNDIIKLVKEYLQENSLVDLTGFVQDHCPPTHTHSAFVRDIAYKLRATGQFEIAERENGERFYIYKVPNKGWRERNPFVHDVILAIITALLSLGVGWLLLKSSDQEQEVKNRKYESDMLILADSLNSLENKLQTIEYSVKHVLDEHRKLKSKVSN